MVDVTPFLPGLPPVQGKAVIARFDGGRLSSEGGLLALREIERRLGLAERLAGCLKDPRMPEKVVHRLAEIIRFRMLIRLYPHLRYVVCSCIDRAKHPPPRSTLPLSGLLDTGPQQRERLVVITVGDARQLDLFEYLGEAPARLVIDAQKFGAWSARRGEQKASRSARQHG